MQKPLTFSGATEEIIQWKLMNEYPKGTTIVNAYKVTKGGLFGLFAKSYYEVEVRPPAAATFPLAGLQPAPPAAGVKALLAEADLAEAKLRRAAPLPELSTGSKDFDQMVRGLTEVVKPGPEAIEAAAEESIVPTPLAVPGSVVLVVGIGNAVVEAARSLAAGVQAAEIRTAGSARMGGFVHVVSAAGVAEARESGAQAGRVAFIAFGLTSDGSLKVPALNEIDADQVWLAVDATRKASDTAAWVRKVAWAKAPDALVVSGAGDTLTPQSVNELEVPVGWVDGRPSTAATL